jgi:hypothetical protein
MSSGLSSSIFLLEKTPAIQENNMRALTIILILVIAKMTVSKTFEIGGR